ncbi:restriction endonuclease subunit S [Psychrobacter sp. M13]|uniref:restriction endonuclease subunit S n=1 Tax=Psychrobacter sp. M13 TaxID=3067275 RepID=UPI00273BCC45|nr:restriction endonuclease subunit S [Psychrobacter sp. M13]WLP93380.1 restriction endonuclease subunit S [Psychrobacter sp. M13]
MAKYQQYDEYKDSGIEWLGDIPNSWGVTHLKFVASIVGRIGFRGYTVDDIVDEGQGAIVLSPSNVDNDQFSLEKKSYLSWAKYFESPEIMVEENDILLVKTGSTFGKSTIVREVGEPMTINPQMVLIKKSSIDSRFLSYLFNSSLIKAKIEVSNTGSGMPTMTQENINNFPIPLPATKIDIKIANFLDHETAQIDTLIEKQQTLIQLLKEKRQAVISHAVTKGLNPDAPMKDSGVEWLGDVPEHWVVTKFSHCAQIRNGLVDPKAPNFKNLVLYAPNHIEKGTGKIVYKETAEEQGADSSKYLCYKGEVIYSKIRPALAKVAICEEETALCSADMYPINAVNGLDNRFLYFFMLSDNFTKAAILDSDRVAMPKINRESLSDYRLPVPLVIEQMEICRFIADQNTKLEELESKAIKAIQLMQERRTALISAAVTGKIDVRGWRAADVL